VALATAATVATADSIIPDSYSTPADPGQLLTFTKELTIGERVDVYFLIQATASMGAELIGDAVANAQSVMNALAGEYGDLAVGVGYYQDFPCPPFGDPPYYGLPGSTPFDDLGGISTDLSAAAAALLSIPTATEDPANDFADSQFHALYQVTGLDTWREGSSRVLVWYGNTPGWDVENTLSNPEPYPANLSIDDVIGALQAAGIIVEAVSLESSLNPDGLNAAATSFGGSVWETTNGPGQADAIAAATGGIVLTSLDVDGIVAAILDAVEVDVGEYSSVGLDLAEAIAEGFDAVYKQRELGWGEDDNAPYTGAWTREEAETFLFDVRLTVPDGVDNIEYVFNIYGTVDGSRVVAELDTITVGDPPGSVVPEPSTVALLGLGLLGLGFAARRKMRK
jgi:hypothetical protein